MCIRDRSYDSNGYPVLNSVKPVEWLNTAQTMRSADTNWIDEISRTGVSQNHQISVSSGTDKSRTFFNLGYENTEGIQIETFWKKYSARLNSEYDLSLIHIYLKFQIPVPPDRHTNK